MYPNETWPSWLLVAWSLRGHKELAKGDNGAIQLMFHDVATNDAADTRDEVPWCAAFVGSCLTRAGYPSSRSLLAKSYLTYGKALDGPALGALVVFNRGSSPAAGHVGFVVGWDEGTVYVLGGNQGNAVTVTPFARSRALAYRQPYTPPPHSMSDFNAALSMVEELEGGWSDHPADTPTMFGITIDTLSRWRAKRVTKAEVKALSRVESRLIYLVFYWFEGHCDRLPSGVDRIHFDACVNHGTKRAAKLLQAAGGAVIDGEIGPETILKASPKAAGEIVAKYASVRMSFYRSLADWPTFGTGWTNRLKKVRALSMADVPLSAQPEADLPPYLRSEKETPVTDSIFDTGKAEPAKVPTAAQEPAAPPKWWLTSKTVWGVMLTFASTVLPVILSFYGIHVTPADINVFGDKAFEVLQIIGGLVGTGMAVYGRAVAVQSIASREFMVKL